jgi:hypothetical protein
MKVTQPHENDYGIYCYMGQRYDFCLDIKSYPLESDMTIFICAAKQENSNFMCSKYCWTRKPFNTHELC